MVASSFVKHNIGLFHCLVPAPGYILPPMPILIMEKYWYMYMDMQSTSINIVEYFLWSAPCKKKPLAGSWMLFDVHAPIQMIWNFQYIFHQKINKYNYLDIILASRLGVWSMQPYFAGNEMTEDRRRTCYCCFLTTLLIYISCFAVINEYVHHLCFSYSRNTTMERV